MAVSPFDRSDYPTLTESVYLNQASLGLGGSPAIDAMHHFLDRVGRHGNLHMSDEDEVGFLDALRDRALQLFRTDASRIAILSSASELLGQVPLMLPPTPAAGVIAVSTDFPAITRPWLRLAERGECLLHFVEDDPETDLTDDLISRIDNDTSLVTVGSVQYTTGTVIDVPRLRAATAATGVKLVIDATQGAGAVDTNVASWRADVVVSSGYKWFGAHGGVAIGAIDPALVDKTPPKPGWMGAPDPFKFDATSMPLAADARRYTQATMSYVSVVGLTMALDRLLMAGVENVEAHAAHLSRLLVDAIEPYGWLPFRPLDDPAASSHIISLNLRPDDSTGITNRLRDIGIVSSSRGGRLRVSLAPYNNEDDIGALVDTLTRRGRV